MKMDLPDRIVKRKEVAAMWGVGPKAVPMLIRRGLIRAPLPVAPGRGGVPELQWLLSEALEDLRAMRLKPQEANRVSVPAEVKEQ